MEQKEFILRDHLEEVRDNYDFIIIDCPPSLSLLTINALTAADTVLVPIQCEYLCAGGTEPGAQDYRPCKKDDESGA